MLCDRKSCERKARWVPVLNLEPASIYSEGVGSEVIVQLRICDQHRDLPASEFLNDEAWERIRKACIEAGYAVPDASRIQLRFIPLP